LYQSQAANANAFFDVTEGGNPDSCCGGYKCGTGFDFVTGLGTPSYRDLKTMLP